MDTLRALRIVLRIVGLVSGSALIPMFMPLAWMDTVHRALGLGPIPPGPVFEYLARSISALYACSGIGLILASRNVLAHLSIVRFYGVAYCLVGLFLLGLDLHAGLPWFWIAVEGPGVVAMGVVFLALHASVSRRQAQVSALTI